MFEKSRQNKWKEVVPQPDSPVPSPRWGHASLVIGKEFVIYGGYADTIYKNDIWSYDAELKQWKEVKTWGNLPENRSNCSMNFDAANNRLVLFGGGGANKKKFNSVHILDWKTKEWKELVPKGEKIPWERTYHSAEVVGKYLVIFGGEVLTDLDDLWVFDFQSQEWTEIAFERGSTKPPGRRFHSSVMHNEQLVIIGGCFGRYRSLNDVWTINLAPLIDHNQTENLIWKEHKLEGSAFLTRWGHTSSMLKDKIYIFGGRFSSDLNDLLVIDLEANNIKVVKKVFDPPTPRRRHCSSFMGNSLLVFGGFNGEYYNDLYFLTLFEETPPITKSTIVEKLLNEVDNPEFSDTAVEVSEEETIHLNSEILASNSFFKNPEKMDTFKQYLKTLNPEEAKQAVRQAYIGGDFEPQSLHLCTPQNKPNYKTYMELLQSNLRRSYKSQTLEFSSSIRNSGFIKILDEEWKHINSESVGEVTFKSKDNTTLKSKKSLLALNSTYFKFLLSGDFLPQPLITIPTWNQNVFKVLVKFLEYDVLFTPDSFQLEEWIQLTLLSQYYHLPRLTQICQSELISSISLECSVDLFKFSIQRQLSHLQSHCAQILIRHECSVFASDGVYLRFDHYQLAEDEGGQEAKMVEAKREKHQSLFFDIQQNITNDLVLLPRGFQHKASLQKICSKKETGKEGKENVNTSIREL